MKKRRDFLKAITQCFAGATVTTTALWLKKASAFPLPILRRKKIHYLLDKDGNKISAEDFYNRDLMVETYVDELVGDISSEIDQINEGLEGLFTSMEGWGRVSGFTTGGGDWCGGGCEGRETGGGNNCGVGCDLGGTGQTGLGCGGSCNDDDGGSRDGNFCGGGCDDAEGTFCGLGCKEVLSDNYVIDIGGIKGGFAELCLMQEYENTIMLQMIKNNPSLV